MYLNESVIYPLSSCPFIIMSTEVSLSKWSNSCPKNTQWNSIDKNMLKKGQFIIYQVNLGHYEFERN